MKKRVLLAAAVGAVLALPVSAALAGSGTDRATGGGQVLFGSPGAGNTIAFTAQGTSESAKGQVQVKDRQNQDTFHGIVDCLAVQGSMAEIYGHRRGTTTVFQLFVKDNGEGAAADNDVVFLDNTPQSQCQFGNDDDDGTTALARGNAQVYDASQ